MLELIKQNYWWPGIKINMFKNALNANRTKYNIRRKQKNYILLKIPQGPWQEISINIIGPLPKSNGKDAIVVIVDRFTKIIRLKVTITNISLEEIAKIYQDEIWKLYGVPKKILSDRGPQFASRFMEEFTKALGTTKQLSMAYHPQCYELRSFELDKSTTLVLE